MDEVKKPRGFQLLTPERRREISSLAGRTSHRTGKARQWDSAAAKQAAMKSVEARRERKRLIDMQVAGAEAGRHDSMIAEYDARNGAGGGQ